MPDPKVSVTIPSYNHAKFLPAAIESILAQTYKNIEIVIVDDGSTDDSFAIANSYAAKHPETIKIFTHPEHRNRGTSATVNLGFDRSTGTYWSGLPSDDLLHPRKIEEQVDFLESHPQIGWVYCYAYYIDETGTRQPEYGLFGDDITQTGNPTEYLLFGNVIPGMTPLMRRTAVAQIEPHDESLIYSDWDFWIRLAASSPVAFQPRSRVMYRMHGSNTGFGSDHETNVRRVILVLNKLQTRALEFGGELARPRTRALINLQLCYFQFAIGEPRAAAAHLASAFAVDHTLRDDAKYFLRWLEFVSRYPDLKGRRFATWLSDHLSPDTPPSWVSEVEQLARRMNFGKQYRLKAHWQSRRRILELLRNDPEALSDSELRKFCIEALLGSRVRRVLSGVLKLGAGEKHEQRNKGKQ